MTGFDPRRARSTRRYRHARRVFLAANPLCAECRRNGIVRAASELDHIQLLRTNRTA